MPRRADGLLVPLDSAKWGHLQRGGMYDVRSLTVSIRQYSIARCNDYCGADAIKVMGSMRNRWQFYWVQDIEYVAPVGIMPWVTEHPRQHISGDCFYLSIWILVIFFLSRVTG